MSSLYDNDILEWSETQAALLRRIAAGEPVNETPDWENIIDEVESVGNEQLHAFESLLAQAMAHLLKARAWPDTRYVGGWEREARLFRRQARRRFAPSMRQKLDIADIYRDALDMVPEEVDGQPGLPVPADCPFTLEDLLARPA